MSLLRRGKGTGRAAARNGHLLDTAEERVDLVRIGQRVPVAVEHAIAVVAVDGPVGPVQIGEGITGIVGRRPHVAALDVVDQVGEPLALAAGAGGIAVARGVSGPELAQPRRRLAIGRRARVAPGVGAVAGPDRVDAAGQVGKAPVAGPDIGQAGGGAAGLVTGAGVEPRLLVFAGPVVVSGVYELVSHRRSQAAGAAAAV